MTQLSTSDLPAVAGLVDHGTNDHGYGVFGLGSFTFERDEYFATVRWPSGHHRISADDFLRAIQRDIAWEFFYGTVNFDGVLGTVNHYGRVDVCAGRFSKEHQAAGMAHTETFPTEVVAEAFLTIADDWTNEGFDPFVAPRETGSAFGRKNGSNPEALRRRRVTAERMVGAPGDEPLRTDDNGHPVNAAFSDVPQDEPVVRAEAGFADELVAFNLFAYLSRSPVTFNPSVVSACRDSLACPTTEEYILPIIHGNDRVEWFIQLSDEMVWEIEDGATGAKRATVVMKAGDVSAMPADIRHQGYSPKRSMLLVWENASTQLPDLIASGTLPSHPDVWSAR
ncbi:hypothetical protein [Kitasatospora sp. GP82]|uniref:hypothetical protein n=1 Tax=Kitasatospora sp. GP82 TaxID=3035089 RepID=UPI002476D2A5|nr:hypothetical protein [Kitasatospora sp. GP82]MDH6124060.1 hypothetical protein [Kitasatospora sp. GP82]